jgi:hypothetical protein
MRRWPLVSAVLRTMLLVTLAAFEWSRGAS